MEGAAAIFKNEKTEIAFIASVCVDRR